MFSPQHTAGRLLRRALEAVLVDPTDHTTETSRWMDALAGQVIYELPPKRTATLVLRETEAEREARERRRCFDPPVRRFDPYVELFVHGRVDTSPWDAEWMRTPLVLHDAGLVHAFDCTFSEPFDHVDTITKILNRHPGPVGSLRMDCSRFPESNTLKGWMDLLSAKGVTELMMMDVTAPPAPAVNFPLSRLVTPTLARLCLGFVRVKLRGCIALLGLEVLTLTCCVCSGRDLSTAICSLEALKTLKVVCCHLNAMGSGSRGTLVVNSKSIVSLELLNSTASALTIRSAPNLHTLIAGVVVGDGSSKLLIDIGGSDELEEVCGLVLDHHQLRFSASQKSSIYKRRQVNALRQVHTLEVALQMSASAESRRLLVELTEQLPGLQLLLLKRMDESSQEEPQIWYELPEAPACFRNSLRYLSMDDYRGGGAEIGLIKKILATARNLEQIQLYAHPCLDNPQFATSLFQDCERAGKSVRITCHLNLL